MTHRENLLSLFRRTGIDHAPVQFHLCPHLVDTYKKQTGAEIPYSDAEVHGRYGDRLSFWGTIGTQTTMPFGSPGDVRNEVLRNLGIAGDKGGLPCAPTHLLEPEVPWCNIEAYVEACRDYL